jgi:hypothetical protein
MYLCFTAATSDSLQPLPLNSAHTLPNTVTRRKLRSAAARLSAQQSRAIVAEDKRYDPGGANSVIGRYYGHEPN